MSLRPATEADIPRLIELGAVMHAESRYSCMSYNPKKVGAMLHAVMARGFMMVAERDGEIIGGFAGVCEPHWFSDDKLATDMGLFIVPGRRGGMAAALLIEAFLSWAEAQGARLTDILINTGVRVDDTAALFDRLGGRNAGLIYSWGGS